MTTIGAHYCPWVPQVAGEIVAELGTLDFASHRGLPCRFFGFVMRVAHIYSDWSENSRKRQWVSEPIGAFRKSTNLRVICC